MSQVFAADSVNFTGTLTINVSAETPVVTGNFLSPPFANAKAIVTATVWFAAGAGNTFVSVRIRRNPNGENLIIPYALNETAAAGNNSVFQMQVADTIPDGRPVQYQVSIQQNGASATGSVFLANVSALLISG